MMFEINIWCLHFSNIDSLSNETYVISHNHIISTTPDWQNFISCDAPPMSHDHACVTRTDQRMSYSLSSHIAHPNHTHHQRMHFPFGPPFQKDHWIYYGLGVHMFRAGMCARHTAVSRISHLRVYVMQEQHAARMKTDDAWSRFKTLYVDVNI